VLVLVNRKILGMVWDDCVQQSATDKQVWVCQVLALYATAGVAHLVTRHKKTPRHRLLGALVLDAYVLLAGRNRD